VSRPQLRIVRPTDPPPPLEHAHGELLPRLVVLPPPPRARWIDSVAAGLLIAGSMLVGAVLVCVAMGWLRVP
jgi:hypothetical protein